MRDSFVFYRSFKTALEDLSNNDKLIMYEAISDYALDKKMPELIGFTKALFSLIKPQLDANWIRYENGRKGGEHGNKGGAPKGNVNAQKSKTTPKQPQETTKTTANVNDNVNDNVKEEREEALTPLQIDCSNLNLKIKSELPFVAKISRQITEKEYETLIAKYSKTEIWNTLGQMDNRKDLVKNYTSVYRTLLNWLKNERKTA